MYVKRNVEMRSCNHCESGKAISITYCECVFVALGIQHSMRMSRITVSTVVCPALQFFPHISQMAQFSKKKSYSAQNACFDSLQI